MKRKDFLRMLVEKNLKNVKKKKLWQKLIRLGCSQQQGQLSKLEKKQEDECD